MDDLSWSLRPDSFGEPGMIASSGADHRLDYMNMASCRSTCEIFHQWALRLRASIVTLRKRAEAGSMHLVNNESIVNSLGVNGHFVKRETI